MMDSKSGAGALTRSLLVALLTGVSSLALSDPAKAQSQQSTEASRDQLVSYNIASQPLSSALNEYARQSGLRALYSYEQVRGLQAPGVRGRLTREQALAQLLAPSGYSARIGDDNTLELANADRPQPTGAEAPVQTSPRQTGAAKSPFDRLADEEDGEEIIVTGTNIRGVYPSSSPVEIFTAEDMARTGATTTEQFIRKLPQNLGTRTRYATGASFDINATAVDGIDLRGLGVGTTLVLLNGRRLTASDRGQAIDISMIPASALARVEVLTDGASAIYGSDAIGGVVNFVLREDFEGAETRVSYGGVTEGGLRQGELSQTFGRNWGVGHGLVTYNYFSTSALGVSDRDYAAGAERGLLTPAEIRQNVLATYSYDLSDRLTLAGDLAYSTRDVKTTYAAVISPTPTDHSLVTTRSDTEQVFAGLSLTYQISDTLSAGVSATYADTTTDRETTVEFYKRLPVTRSVVSRTQQPSLLDIAASLNGALFSLPGGRARFALGLGLLTEDYSGEALANVVTPSALSRDTHYAYGELFLPLIGGEQNIPLVERLELSLAARHTHHEDTSNQTIERDFGESTDPKLGLLWAPFDALNLRATYGRSFRAPPLIQTNDSNAQNILANWLPIPFPAGPTANLVYTLNNSVPDLGPETAETYSLGFDFQPAAFPGWRLSGTYYNISYEDRIATAPTGGVGYLMTPNLYPDAIYPAPSAQFIEDILRSSTNIINLLGINLADPQIAAQQIFALPNLWIIDSRRRNLAISEQDGFDLSLNTEAETTFGDTRFGATLTRILSYRQQASAGSAVVSVVDRASQPVDLRARAFASLSRGGFDGAVSINYVDDYANPDGVGGARPVGSWTTADLNLSYDFGADQRRHDGVRVNLSVQNLFNKDPPRIARASGQTGVQEPVGFDPANANPLGRMIVLSLTKAW